MQVKNLHSYAYFGTKQFPVDLPVILGSDLITSMGGNWSTYERNYQNLHESSPSNIFKRNFNGYDVWGAICKCYQKILLLSDQPNPSDSTITDLMSLLKLNYSMMKADSSYSSPSTTYMGIATSIYTTRGSAYTIGGTLSIGGAGKVFYLEGTGTVTRFSSGDMVMCMFRFYPESNYVYFDFAVFPDDIIVNGAANPNYKNVTPYVNTGFRCSGHIYFNNAMTEITEVRFSNVSGINNGGFLYAMLGTIKIPFEDEHVDDLDNPYGEDGTSTTGGGDGDLPGGPGGLDFIDPTDIPDLPSVSAVATGFITMYNPSSANLSALGSFLWSGQFDLDTYKKLFADPMQGIIGLGIVPKLPNSAGSRNIMFGNVDTGVNCSYLASQYASQDCGSVNIQKYVGSFMDYSPYVKISMFLPYIGFVNLGTDDIMGGSINVKYNIDVLTGDCIAFIKHNTKGVLYAYHGNCLTNVPVSGQNYANALKNYYESVAGIIPATTNGAAGGPIGAIAGAATGALNAASNVVLNSKPTFQRSGNIGGSAGILGVQKPFVIIERPNISVPNKVQHYLGQTSNITMGLGECSGLTVVEAVHLNGISATSKELAEIDSLLKGGVIL